MNSIIYPVLKSRTKMSENSTISPDPSVSAINHKRKTKNVSTKKKMQKMLKG